MTDDKAGSDLVERLRVGATTSHDVGVHLQKYQALCDEAAAEIERFTAEVERLDGLRRAELEHSERYLAEDRATITTLRATNERLRNLVQSAYNEGFTEGMKEHTHSRGGKPWPDSRARAALQEPENGK